MTWRIISERFVFSSFYPVWIADTNVEYLEPRFRSILICNIILAVSRWMCDPALVRLITLLSVSW